LTFLYKYAIIYTDYKVIPTDYRGAAERRKAVSNRVGTLKFFAMSKMKIATLVTVVVMVAYALYLVVLNLEFDLPVETSLTLFGHRGPIFDLPFSVSYWWNLAFFPGILFFLGYFINRDEIIGDIPENFKEKVYLRYSTRQVYHWANIFGMVVGLLVVCLSIILWPLVKVLSVGNAETTMIGPATTAVMATIFYVVARVAVSIFMPFQFFLSGDYVEKLSIEERYETSLVSYVKMGIAKTFFCILGLTLGYITIFILRGVKKFFVK
jgi:hypothetical protein